MIGLIFIFIWSLVVASANASTENENYGTLVKRGPKRLRKSQIRKNTLFRQVLPPIPEDLPWNDFLSLDQASGETSPVDSHHDINSQISELTSDISDHNLKKNIKYILYRMAYKSPAPFSKMQLLKSTLNDLSTDSIEYKTLEHILRGEKMTDRIAVLNSQKEAVDDDDVAFSSEGFDRLMENSMSDDEFDELDYEDDESDKPFHDGNSKGLWSADALGDDLDDSRHRGSKSFSPPKALGDDLDDSRHRGSKSYSPPKALGDDLDDSRHNGAKWSSTADALGDDLDDSSYKGVKSFSPPKTSSINLNNPSHRAMVSNRYSMPRNPFNFDTLSDELDESSRHSHKKTQTPKKFEFYSIIDDLVRGIADPFAKVRIQQYLLNNANHMVQPFTKFDLLKKAIQKAPSDFKDRIWLNILLADESTIKEEEGSLDLLLQKAHDEESSLSTASNQNRIIPTQMNGFDQRRKENGLEIVSSNPVPLSYPEKNDLGNTQRNPNFMSHQIKELSSFYKNKEERDKIFNYLKGIAESSSKTFSNFDLLKEGLSVAWTSQKFDMYRLLKDHDIVKDQMLGF